jgi:Skp family chaperone for outer membrane proteins
MKYISQKILLCALATGSLVINNQNIQAVKKGKGAKQVESALKDRAQAKTKSKAKAQVKTKDKAQAKTKKSKPDTEVNQIILEYGKKAQKYFKELEKSVAQNNKQVGQRIARNINQMRKEFSDKVSDNIDNLGDDQDTAITYLKAISSDPKNSLIVTLTEVFKPINQ